MTATLHERVCSLMHDGSPRFMLEIQDAVGSNPNGLYPVLAKLETEESLKSMADPQSGRRLYVWNDA